MLQGFRDGRKGGAQTRLDHRHPYRPPLVGMLSAANAITRRNYNTSSLVLRAVDARTRRMRVRNMSLTTPLIATVFNLLALAIAAQPVLDASTSTASSARSRSYSPGRP